MHSVPEQTLECLIACLGGVPNWCQPFWCIKGTYNLNKIEINLAEGEKLQIKNNAKYYHTKY